MKRKKRITVMLIFCFSLALVGWGKGKIELSNGSKSPLINLDAAIERAQWGKQGSTEIVTDDTSDPVVEEPAESHDDGNEQSKKAEKLGISYKIRIEGKNILFQDSVMNFDELESELRNLKQGDSVYLFDNYADSETYKGVIELLETLRSETGLSYSGDNVEIWWK